MPAAPSSAIDPAIDHLVMVTERLSDRASLLAVLDGVSDPRKPRGLRHALACMLTLAACAVLAGARSFTAIAEWAADADQATLSEVGAVRGAPSESTFRRTLQRVDGGDLDARLGAWAQTRAAPPPQGQTGRAGRWRGVAVDGEDRSWFGHRRTVRAGPDGRPPPRVRRRARAGRDRLQDERDPAVLNASRHDQPDQLRGHRRRIMRTSA